MRFESAFKLMITGHFIKRQVWDRECMFIDSNFKIHMIGSYNSDKYLFESYTISELLLMMRHDDFVTTTVNKTSIHPSYEQDIDIKYRSDIASTIAVDGSTFTMFIDNLLNGEHITSMQDTNIIDYYLSSDANIRLMVNTPLMENADVFDYTIKEPEKMLCGLLSYNDYAIMNDRVQIQQAVDRSFLLDYYKQLLDGQSIPYGEGANIILNDSGLFIEIKDDTNSTPDGVFLDRISISTLDSILFRKYK